MDMKFKNRQNELMVIEVRVEHPSEAGCVLTREGHEETFRGSGNILHLDLHGNYMGVHM